MSDSTFGGSRSSGSSSDSGFDFFGGNGAPQGSTGSAPGPAPSAFGSGAPAQSTAPDGSAAPSFGSPAFGAPPTPSFGAPPAPSFGAPAGPNGFGLSNGTPSMAVASSNGTKRTVGLIVLALAVLFGGFRLWSFYEHHKGITLPTTLGGQPQNTDLTVTDTLATTKQAIQSKNPDFTLDGAFYGNTANASVLFIIRGDADVTKELSDIGGKQERVGDATCTLPAGRTAIACIRTGGQLTVLVMAAYGDGDQARIVALVDEAWAQQ